METSTFKYLDSNSVIQTQDLDILIHKGLDKLWKFNLVPPEAFYKLIDGSSSTDYRGFQRIVGIELTALNEYDAFIRAFLQAATKSIKLLENLIPIARASVVFESPEFETEWFDEFKFAKRYVMEFTESTVRHSWPFLPTGTDMIYIAQRIKVEGDGTTPELFTTNVSKLQYNFGTTPFPDMFLDDYIISVVGSDYQDATIYQVGLATQSGNNISFYLAHSYNGNASADGFYYCDLSFLLQTKV